MTFAFINNFFLLNEYLEAVMVAEKELEENSRLEQVYRGEY